MTKEEIQKSLGEESEIIFGIATKRKNRAGWDIYASDKYKLTELDIINLIKLLLVNRRDVSVGRKILAMYQDCTDYAPKTYEKLKNIGIIVDENEQPIKPTKSRIFCILF
jgi:hypothetical protein